ncbi:MAG: hypothetical protein J5511_02215 [Bacilli bacterium]|nr:hypothetical protein [Bacilli bacterium]
MNKDQFPKVLVIGISPWNKHEGTDTLQSIFSCWQKDKLAQIYTRSGNPCSDVCDDFFRISENRLIKSVINRKPVGERVFNDTSNDGNKDFAEESERYTKAHKKKSWLMSFAREFVWLLGKWKTAQLNAFIDEVKPDILFIPVYQNIYMCRLQEYVIRKTKLPYVCYLADDNYTYKSCGKNPLELLYRFFLRKHVKKISKNCKQMYTITQIEGDETDKFFGTHSVVLAKSIDFSHINFVSKQLNKPISLVYTGNLLIGRDSTIEKVAEAVTKINEESNKIIFHIYTHTPPKDSLLKRIASDSVIYHGKVDKNQVSSIQKDADILLFVESLKKKDKFKARMSFSTKLVDYFASGKCIFAIADKEVAPIMYLKDNDAAIISTNTAEIYEQLKRLVDNESLIEEYSRKSFECGKKNHDKNDIDNRFIDTMINASNKGK